MVGGSLWIQYTGLCLMFFARARKRPDTITLTSALRAPDPGARCRAARWLGSTGDRGMIPPLLAALADEHAGVRRAVMTALERLGAAEPALMVREVWRGNAEAAQLASDPRLLPALLLPLRQGDIGSRCAAAAALARLGEADAVPALAVALYDPILAVRRAAAKALGELRDPAALPALLSLLERHDPSADRTMARELRAAALLALGWLGDSRALPAIEAALEEPELAEPAAVALGVLGNPQATPALVQALMNPEERVRRAAASSLGLLRDPHTADALIGLLMDPSGVVRREAIAALTRMGDVRLAELARAVELGMPEQVMALDRKRAPQLLRALLLDARADTRLRAARLLGELGDPAAIPDLRVRSRWWSESDARVRHACLDAIETIRRSSGREGVPSVPPEGSGREGAALE